MLTAIVLIASVSFSWLPVRLLFKGSGKPLKKTTVLAAAFLIGLLLTMLLGFGYLSVYYRADDEARKALLGTPSVKVTEIDGGYFFDGPSDKNAIIFYPGARIDSAAYAPLMLQLAESGFDCFLVQMPFHFALLRRNAADAFLGTCSYDTWIMTGHSLGAMVAADYAENHTEQIDGVVLLAAYPAKKLDNSLKLCSIYGDKDGCLDKGVYQMRKAYWPADSQEIIIRGGNHSQFGNYGLQKGDGAADITGKEQRAEAVEAIAAFFTLFF